MEVLGLLGHSELKGYICAERMPQELGFQKENNKLAGFDIYFSLLGSMNTQCTRLRQHMKGSFQSYTSNLANFELCCLFVVRLGELWYLFYNNINSICIFSSQELNRVLRFSLRRRIPVMFGCQHSKSQNTQSCATPDCLNSLGH